jgi:hypothetical protein
MSEENGQQNQEASGSEESSGGLGGAGSQNTEPTGWKSALDAEFSGSPTIQNIKAETNSQAIQELAKQLVHAQKLVGVDKIPALKATASPEERSEWMQSHLGVPKEAAEYKFQQKLVVGEDEKGNPLEQEVSEATIERMRRIAHVSQLTPAQAEAQLLEYVKLDAEDSTKLAEEQQAAITAAMAGMADELGYDFKPTMDLANDAFSRLVPDELQSRIPDALKNDPDFIKMFADFGKNLKDDVSRGGSTSGTDVFEPAQALRAIQDLESSEPFKKLMSGDPTLSVTEAGNIKERRAKLYRMAYD